LLQIFIWRDKQHQNLLFSTFALYLLSPGPESRHHSDGFSSDASHWFPQVMQAYARKIHIYYVRFFPQILSNSLLTK